MESDSFFAVFRTIKNYIKKKKLEIYHINNRAI